MSTTLHSFVNDGSEHTHIYIYICDKREETVEREEGRKKQKKKKKKDNSKRHTPNTRT